MKTTLLRTVNAGLDRIISAAARETAPASTTLSR